MSNPDDHFHYGCFPRPRNSPAPGGNNPNNNRHGGRRGLFGMGHGGRTVLPPLFRSSRSPAPEMSFPANQYAHQEATQGRNEYDVHAYGQTSQWPLNTGQNNLQATAYHTDPRYPAQHNTYPAPFPSRPGASMAIDPHDPRSLPPAGGSHQSHYYPGAGPEHAMASASTMRSPTGNYPPGFSSFENPASASYYGAPDPRNLPPAVPPMSYNPSQGAAMGRRSSMSVDRTVHSRASVHGQVPYARVPPQAPSYEEPEPMIKKKRKRADAEQLKVLNDTYNRTAFPSTEERVELAKKLGMSARSVQIWFQNKRQAMRNSQRQAAASAPRPPSSHPYSDSALAGAVPTPGYPGQSSSRPVSSAMGPVPGPAPYPAYAGHVSPSHGYDTPSPSSRGRSRDAERMPRRSTSRPR
ncbi:homeobox-domain-containing protein [Panus rudis PR-1116 ss-1]|nr:homeobox-domain-containing protein [Panus rudis PR-1116 ss-1]